MNDLEENVTYLLKRSPFTVRDMSGEHTGIRGKEYLSGSLAITFLGMENIMNLRNNCVVDKSSSRCCELGTRSCTVHHK